MSVGDITGGSLPRCWQEEQVMAGHLLCDADNEPMVYISRDTADAKAAIIATTPGIAKASVRARYFRGEMLGYVIRVIPRGMLEGSRLPMLWIS